MKKLSEKLDSVLSGLSTEDLSLCRGNKYPYIFTKSFYFLEDGPEIFKLKDALGFPDYSFSKFEIEKIKNGCQQILEGKGFRKQYPISNLGIKSFYKLFKLFHFELINQKAIKLKNGHFLDKITFEHIVDKSIINYYNLV